MTAVRVAIPIFDGRVSPRLDCASRFLLLERDGDGKMEELHLGCREPLEMVERLRELAVGVIVCGGVSSFYERHLSEAGFELISWVSGPVAEIVEALRRGTLQSGQRCSGRRNRRGRAGHRLEGGRRNAKR